MRVLFSLWWPLAVSWLLMGLELPAVSAAIARLPEPERHLAAYGGVTLPICFIIEAPIVMLLSASTTLCRDRGSYRLVYRFMMWSSAGLTLIHALLAFTPLFDLVVKDIIRPPAEVVEYVRTGLQITIPWTWAIAYRRFHQGLIVRFGNPRLVGLGTVVRLAAIFLVLGSGLLLGDVPGVVVGALAIVCGVVAEAIFVGVASRTAVRGIPDIDEGAQVLTPAAFYRFYGPLMLTALVYLGSQPIASAALSRLPEALPSLAIWPVLLGLSFLLRSTAMALPEVIVSRLDDSRLAPAMWGFSVRLGMGLTMLISLVLLTPFSDVWFAGISGLHESLVPYASQAALFLLPLPLLATILAWCEGHLLYARRTQVITEAITLHLIASCMVMALGIYSQSVRGLFVVQAAVLAGWACQLAWAWRGVRRLPTT